MSFIKKNVNPVLLVLIVFLVVALVGLTSYYQTTYSKVSRNYYAKVQEYNKLSNDFTEHKSKLNETLVQYQLKDERERDLSTKYTELRDVKEVLTWTLNKTNNSLIHTQNELKTTTSELLDSLAKNNQLTIDVTTKSLKITNYETRVKSLSNDLEYLETEIDDALSTNSTMCTGLIHGINQKYSLVDQDTRALLALK